METKELNLCEILKDCTKGTKLYSPIYGFMRLHSVNDESHSYPISMADAEGCLHTFHSDGRLFLNTQSECCLFPSKENRDWSTFKPKKEHFDPKTLKPFDKVLVRYTDSTPWQIDHFGYIYPERYICSSGCSWKSCIPYNDDTKHLVGTTDEAPEYYRYWE